MTKDTPRVIAASKRWAPVAALTDRYFNIPVWKALVQHIPTTEPEMLEYLAAEMELLETAAWQAATTDKQRRYLIEQAHTRHRTRGTNAGLRREAAEAGGEVRRIIAPPNKFFASAAPTPAERNAWLANMPEIRIYSRREPGQAGAVAFARRMFPGYRCFSVRSDALERSRLKVTLVQNGVETPLETWDVELASRQRLAVNRIVIPGKAGSRAFIGRMFAGRSWPMLSDASTRQIILEDVAYYSEPTATRHLRTVQPGLTPIDADGEIIAERHPASPGASFARRMFPGAGYFVLPSRAYRHNYRRIKLHDPSAPVTRARAASHVGVTRLGMPPHHAHIEVALFGKRNPAFGRFAGQPVVTGDRQPLQRLLANLRLTKRESDVLTLSTKIFKPLQAGWHLLAGEHIAGQTTQK